MCTAVRRHATRTDGTDLIEPAQAGLQLFLGDLDPGGRSRPRVDHNEGDDGGVDLTGGEVDGQLELVNVAPQSARAAAAADSWAGSPTGQAALAELAAFGAARGWRPATLRAVAEGLALLSVSDPARRLSPEVLGECRRRRLPVSRLREFLTSHYTQDQSPVATDPVADHDVRLLGSLPAHLSTTMSRELAVWLSVLSGTIGRSRPLAESTVAAYRRAVLPVVADWADRHESLREVTSDDVNAALQPLTGSARTGTAVALRSLFAAVKSQRMIFTNPAGRVRPGRFPRRPVLGLDDASRSALLGDTPRTDHRLVLLLAGVHALSRADLTALRLDEVDLPSARLSLRGRQILLDNLTLRELRAWLEERRARWPATANPHLLITGKSAYGLTPVSSQYFRGLPARTSQLRADRLLTAAADSSGDPLTLVRLFGVSDDTAVRYCTELDRVTPSTGT